MRLATLLLAVAPLSAEVRIVLLEAPVPRVAGEVLSLGEVAIGAPNEFLFRAENTGAVSVTVSRMSVSGAAFALATPFTQFSLAPRTAREFAVRFQPQAAGSYSAVVAVENAVTVLLATAVPGPTVQLSSLDPLPDGAVEIVSSAGETATLRLIVSAPSGVPAALSQAGVWGEGFSLEAPPLPAALSDGNTVELALRFRGDAPGDWPGHLRIGSRQIRLLARVAAAPPDRPRILLSEGAASGRQISLRLERASPAIETETGMVRVRFGGGWEDAAIRFAGGGREAAYTIPTGARAAKFGDAEALLLQTGTSAGVLHLEVASADGATETVDFALPPAPVTVDTASARRNAGALEVDFTGFDNTRGAGSVNFHFFDRAGSPLGVIATAPADLFRAYFASSTLGGVFRFRAAFPVSGDATMVGSVTVEVANSVGRTTLTRLPFP